MNYLQTFAKLYCSVPATPLYMDRQRVLPDASQRVINHSPDGFSWGYGGSGPAQLALAILMLLFPVSIARKYYQKFKFDLVATVPQDGEFILTWEQVDAWCKENVSELRSEKTIDSH